MVSHRRKKNNRRAFHVHRVHVVLHEFCSLVFGVILWSFGSFKTFATLYFEFDWSWREKNKIIGHQGEAFSIH